MSMIVKPDKCNALIFEGSTSYSLTVSQFVDFTLKAMGATSCFLNTSMIRSAAMSTSIQSSWLVLRHRVSQSYGVPHA